MKRTALRHALALALCSPAAAEETMGSLGIAAGSKLASIFSSADANSDAVLSDSELAGFVETSNGLVAGFRLAEPFEATLFAGEDCSGDSHVVGPSTSEARCADCFDVCDKRFPGGARMADVDGHAVWGVDSKVRSLNVTSGAARVVLNLCLGTYNYGVAGVALTSVQTSRDGCVNFQPGQAPAHVAAVPTELLELAASIFLKADREPADDRLDEAEAAAVSLAPLVRPADRNGDEVMSLEEYTTVLVHDAAREAGEKHFLSATAMQDAALTAATATASGSTDHVPEAEQTAKAQQLFADAYVQAVSDPAVGVTTPVPRDPNGMPIVDVGGEAADDGDVRDPSPVEGPYDPQAAEVTMCVDGKDFQGGRCYDYCNLDYPVAALSMCFKKDCPSGWTETVGGLCKKTGFHIQTKAKDNYNRGAGVLPATCRLGDSFGPGAHPDDGTRDFTVVLASDPQLPWCSGETKSDVDCAVKENFRLVQGIHNVRQLTWVTDGNGTAQEVAEPIGVMITGDLTAYAHNWQFRLYRQIWETREGASQDQNLKLPVWPGLGNHDYANNLGGCWWADEEPTWSGYGKSSCAQRMVAYIRGAVAGCDGKAVASNFGGHVDHYDKASAGYTVRKGRIRFVHLHNYPTFRRNELVGVASTIQFLKDEVAEAERTRDYLVLLIHDVNGHFSPWRTDDQVERYDYFSEVVAGSRTIAVFSGHFHPLGGQHTGSWAHLRDSRTEADLQNAFGEAVPSLRSYAPDKSAFLVTQWNLGRCFWRFGAVKVPGKDEAAGPPDWKSVEKDQQNTFSIPDCVVEGPGGSQTPKDMMVSAAGGAPALLAPALLALAPRLWG